jgi:hypothetical protein
MDGISSQAEDVSASQQALSSMELIRQGIKETHAGNCFSVSPPNIIH